jgi:dTDP-4-amino-4,6-dideoxygalactose transaminase
VAAAIGPRTAAVLPVHLYGQVCAMDELRSLAQQHGLLLFEDAAQAQGAMYRGKRAGSLGTAAAFSFYPSKNLGALGDAGAICTDDDDIAATARRLRDLGRLGDGLHAVAGYNERLDGLQAAFLRVKLGYLDQWNDARRTVAAIYRERLRDAELGLVVEQPDSPCIYHLFPIRLRGRDALAKSLAKANIASGVHYPLCLPQQPALPELADYPVPAARAWAATELSLPIFPALSLSEVNRIADAVLVPTA